MLPAKSMRSLGRSGNKPASPDVCVHAINYPPEPTGIAPYVGALAKGLSDAGYDVRSYTAHPHYPEWKIHPGYGQWSASETTGGVKVRRFLHYVPRSPRGWRRLLSEMSFGLRLSTARWNRPRVIVSVSPSLFSTALTAMRVKVTRRSPRLIVWVQDIYTLGLAETDAGGGLARRVMKSVEKFTLKAADLVVVIHERFAEVVSSEFGVEVSKVQVVRNWTHLPPSDPVDVRGARKALGWSDNTIVALHAGNMGAKQGLQNLVDAARLADEQGSRVHFVLVGNGGEREQLEHSARGVARISFIDPLDDADYRLALAAADVLLVNEKPGVASMAVPSKLTSYFDAGRPVVAATDPDGITASEITASGAGVSVQAGRPEAVLSAVESLASDPSTASQLGAKGRRYRERVLEESAAIARWVSIVSTETVAGRSSDGNAS